MRERYFNAVHEFFVAVNVRSEVEACGNLVLEEHHPNFLPVGVVHGGVEGDELEIGFVWVQFFVDGVVEHAHVVVGDVGREGSDPVDVVVNLVVDLVVPISLHANMQLKLRIDQAQQHRCGDLQQDKLQNGSFAPRHEKLGLSPARQLVRFLKVVARSIMRDLRSSIAHL